jgi:3,4-dihydroxy-2-butanone 4-phosphate synthase
MDELFAIDGQAREQGLTHHDRQVLRLQKARPLLVDKNTSRYQANFTVSIEAAVGVTTGVSAHDRLQTVRSAIADKAKPSDLCRPGHVFPLRARPGGVLERPDHTEATVDLMCLAGLIAMFAGASGSYPPSPGAFGIVVWVLEMVEILG